MPNLIQLQQCGLAERQVHDFSGILLMAFDRWAINTPKRQAYFLGQAMHESTKFTALEENLYYSKPERIMAVFKTRVTTLEQAQKLTRNAKDLANTVYANRYGNGDFASGDGYAFRGSGIGGLTFHDNFKAAGARLGVDLVGNPDLVRQPMYGTYTFADYWAARGCNELADAGDVKGITIKVNGPAADGLDSREAFTNTCLNALGCTA